MSQEESKPRGEDSPEFYDLEWLFDDKDKRDRVTILDPEHDMVTNWITANNEDAKDLEEVR